MHDTTAHKPIHLVVIGHARSGTTVLLNALNTSPDAYLLGEPFSYRDSGERGFRARFNRAHRSYRNQISKSTYAPRLPGLAEDAPAAEYLRALREHYAIYGEKIGLTSPRYGSDFARLQDWLEDHRPHCLFVFREPGDVLDSTAKMFEFTTSTDNILSYALTARLYLNLARVLPDVRHVLHSEIAQGTFEVLGRWLGADFSSAHACYDAPRQQRRDPAQSSPEIETLNAAYDFLSRQAPRDGLIPPALLQTEQKLSGENGNELGKLYADLNALVASLGRNYLGNDIEFAG
jgi:hypothetical protein